MPFKRLVYSNKWIFYATNICQGALEGIDNRLPLYCPTDQEVLIIVAKVLGSGHLHLLGDPLFQVLCLAEILVPVHGGHQLLPQVC